jgi:hypothetical protein
MNLIPLVLACALAQDSYPFPKPNKHHESLKVCEGTWDFVATFTGPDGSKSEAKGVQTEKLCGNGLWLVMDAQGELMGQKFWGHGMVGYDEMKKKFVFTWVDSMSTMIQPGEGDGSDDDKTITLLVDVVGMDGKPAKMKQVSKVLDQDNKTLTFLMTGPDGKEFEMGVIQYKRKK